MSTERTIDYYRLLEVDPEASLEVIERVYLVLAKRHHPDLNGSDPATTLLMQDLNEAMCVIRSPTRRAAYDRSRGLEHTVRAGSVVTDASGHRTAAAYTSAGQYESFTWGVSADSYPATGEPTTSTSGFRWIPRSGTGVTSRATADTGRRVWRRRLVDLVLTVLKWVVIVLVVWQVAYELIALAVWVTKSLS